MSKKVALTERTVLFIKDFCTKVHNARKSRDIKNDDRGNRRIINEMVGKIGEVAAHFVCGGKTPDFEIYENGKPTFDADLGNSIHVKTCHLRFRDNPLDSWTADKKDPLCFSPTVDDKIILVYANEYGKATVEGYINAKDVVKYWKPTRNLPHKVALYKNDIKQFIHPPERL